MNRFLRLAITAFLLLTATLAVLGDAAAAKLAMCRVCVVNHGEGEEEEVKATRTWQGKEYGFCSEKCAKTFDADPAAYAPPDFPRAAPAFALKDLKGKELSLASLEGKVVLLDFWATWCAPCKKSMPELQALHDKYSARGFTAVGVSVDEKGEGKVKKYVAAKKFTYPMAMDSAEGSAWTAYGVKAVPAAFLIDREGSIVAQWTGALRIAELEERLQSLLGTAD